VPFPGPTDGGDKRRILVNNFDAAVGSAIRCN